jgi:hypothetical protein
VVSAARTHEVRDDLALDQILDMIIAIARIHGDPGYLEPILQTTLDGLRHPTDLKLAQNRPSLEAERLSAR